MTKDEQITVDQAMRVLQSDYDSDIRSLREDFQQAVKDGEISDRDDAERWIHESIDGHQRVIYTGHAMMVCRLSDADPQDGIEEGIVDVKSPMFWSQMAYYCMESDLRNELNMHDIDLDNLEGDETEED